MILVNEDNPVSSLSSEQLQDLYLKDGQNWSEYGGEDLPVTTYQLTEGNGSQTAFARYVDGVQLSESHREIETMNAIIDEVAMDRGGICYAFASYYFGSYTKGNTKVIKIDGKSYDDPEYALTCMVSAYFCESEASADVKRFVGLFEMKNSTYEMYILQEMEICN